MENSHTLTESYTVAATQRRHPLDPLGAEEVSTAVRILRSHGPAVDHLRFVSINLHEPAKTEVESAASRDTLDRRAFVIVIDLAGRRVLEALVSLRHETLLSCEVRQGVQPGIIIEEFIMCENAVKADPRWRAALSRRGIIEFDKAIVDPWSAGAYGDERFPDRRLAQGLTWIRGSDTDVGYGRPVEGLITFVDLEKMEVVEVIDDVQVPLPPLTGTYAAECLEPLRQDLKPLEISQPEGPSFTVDGYEVRWQKWRFRVGFTSREGLVLHQLGYEDQGRLRPILYRASLSEMQVPYGDPTRTHNKKNAFDVGEYGIGRMANSLKLGCDCVGTIRYFDAHMVNMAGEVETIERAICMHEEDYGTLWKHTDWRTNRSEVRRSRRLVISFFATVGNYDYGFYWYLYQSGEIQLEVKLTGCLSVGACPPGVQPAHGARVAPQLYAPIHQHYFNFRLDMDVDGPGNSVYEVDTVADPVGPANPYNGAYRPRYTLIRNHLEAARDAAPAIGRAWLIANPSRLNSVGQPTGYKLMPGADVVLPFAQEGASIRRRAGFIAHNLWITAYDPAQRYASGDYINQNPAPNGLAQWIERDRPLENTDLVAWYSFGVHHIPRPEDWPVMPVSYAGFMLKPSGFFEQNPAMDVAPPQPSHKCCD
jgi:primary-amine oxidase